MSQSMKLFVEAVDKNGDGQIDLDELLSLMRKLGAEGSDEELLQVFGDMDVDESGHDDHEEFSAWWDSMNYFDVMGRFR
jgi:Ca2+-binding EF-hand superfamily protein